MRKPNWKRRGLYAPLTEEQRKKFRDFVKLERRIANLPSELKEFARKNPGLVY